MKNTRFTSVLILAAAAVMSQAQTYAVREISAGGQANAISGGVVGGSLNGGAILWNETGSINMHPAGYTFSAIFGLNGNMSVGYAGTSSTAQSPLMWVGTSPTVLPVPFAYLIGRATATDGLQIVGTATEGNLERGFGASHALLWNVADGSVVDLGKNNTVLGVGGGVQVGTKLGSKGTTAGMWRGTAASFVDLHPRSYDVSIACDTNGAVQVGYVGLDVRVRSEGRPRDIRFYSAGYWTGSATSFTYLPSPYRHTFALGIKGDTIVGYGNTSDAIGTPIASQAAAWVGDAHDFVDLHALLPADMRTSRATGVDEYGNIEGFGVTTSGTVRSYVWIRQ